MSEKVDWLIEMREQTEALKQAGSVGHGGTEAAFDLREIRARRSTYPGQTGEQRAEFIAFAPGDIDALVAEVEKIPTSIRELVDRHTDTWAQMPRSYWFYRLCQEVGELGSALADDHEHGPEHELAQIASICINWLEGYCARERFLSTLETRGQLAGRSK